MARLFNNMRGAARWVAMLAVALAIQFGLCSVTPVILRVAATHANDDLTPWIYLPALQLLLFLVTLIALFVALIFAWIQRMKSRRMQ